MRLRKPKLALKTDLRQLLKKEKMPEDMALLAQCVKELDFKQQGPLVYRSVKVLQALYTVWKMKIQEEDVASEFKTVEWSNLEKTRYNLKCMVQTYEEHCRMSALQREEVRLMLKENPIYYEAACIAEDVYFDESRELPGGWRRSQEHADLLFRDLSGCGLKSGLYERDGKEGKEYIYATAGTNPFDEKDWQNNLYQVVGHSAQYDLALSIANELSVRIGKEEGNLMFVGHSLGGGEATNNALATGHPAIVFNPAGLSQVSMEKTHVDPKQAEILVTNFITDNDVLNWMQDCASRIKVWRLLVPTSIGHKYFLPMSQNRRIGHTMPPIIEYFEATQSC